MTLRQVLAPFVLTALLLLGILVVVLVPIALTQFEPMGMISMFLTGPFRTVRHSGNIIEMATPAMLCGLAVALMFRSGVMNLGVEGAFFLGGLATVSTILLVPMPSWALIPTGLLVGTIFGSSVCIVPGYLRAKFEVSELVSSLMLNFAALFVGLYVVNYVLRDPSAGAMVSHKLPDAARFARLIDGTRIHFGTIIAFLACVVGYFYLFRSKGGFDARIVGANPGFALHLGLPMQTLMLRAQIVGGGIAAAAGGIELLGMYQRFSWQALPGNGWTGVVVAILARDHPLMIIPAALFLSYLQVGGDLVARNYDVPSEVVGLIQALVLICVTAAAIAQNPKLLSLLGGRNEAKSS